MSTTPPIVGFADTWVTPLIRRWGVVVGLGVVMTVVGVWLLANPFGAVRTLALLVAFGLFFTSMDELAQAERHQIRWLSYVLAAIWFATALLALLWPGVTVWVLAVIVGVGMIVGGIAESLFAARFRRELPMWGLWVVDGLFSVVIGVFALVWPHATILVLAIVLGIRVLLRGISTTAFGFSLRRLHRMTSPYVPT